MSKYELATISYNKDSIKWSGLGVGDTFRFSSSDNVVCIKTSTDVFVCIRDNSISVHPRPADDVELCGIKGLKSITIYFKE